MLNNSLNITIKKIMDILKILSYVSSKCATDGCAEQAWQDGYCKDCANYLLQKNTLLTFKTDCELTKDMVRSIGRIETNLSSFKQNAKIPHHLKTYDDNYTGIVSKQIGKIKTTDTFIPNIEIEQAQLLTPKISKESKDINKLAEKLKAAQRHGENYNESKKQH